MASLTLRRVGGSVVATFPKALLELLNATEGDTVEYTFDDGKLIIESKQKKRRKLPKYDLSQLLEEHNRSCPCWKKSMKFGEKINVRAPNYYEKGTSTR